MILLSIGFDNVCVCSSVDGILSMGSMLFLFCSLVLRASRRRLRKLLAACNRSLCDQSGGSFETELGQSFYEMFRLLFSDGVNNENCKSDEFHGLSIFDWMVSAQSNGKATRLY